MKKDTKQKEYFLNNLGNYFKNRFIKHSMKSLEKMKNLSGGFPTVE